MAHHRAQLRVRRPWGCPDVPVVPCHRLADPDDRLRLRAAERQSGSWALYRRYIPRHRHHHRRSPELTVKRLLRIAIAFMLVALASAAVPPHANAQASSEKYDAMFRKYAKRFFGPGFDWRLLQAQGMAVSNRNPQARSGACARGIMQLMTSTYKEVRSRNPDLGKIDDPEWNIAAGISYNRQLWRQWQPESDVRHLYEFMFGSYNAG